MVSNINYLNNLRALGFNTFNNWWDEAYDGLGEADRINAIEQLLNSIANKPLSELTEMLKSMQTVLDHNYNTFMSLTASTIERKFN